MSGPELWRLAAEWLRDVGVLDPESGALARNARVYDLALALQDGTALCNALNIIKPGVVRDISERPEKQFLKMRNINAFLDAIQKMGVKERDCFTADQLYYASDFPRVVNTLSLLSKTSGSTSRGFSPFPASGGAADTAEYGEDMYQSLENLIHQSLSLEEAALEALPAGFLTEEGEEEDIYGAIQGLIEEGTSDDVYRDLIGGSDPAAPSSEALAAVGSEEFDSEDIYAPGPGMGATLQPSERRNQVLEELHQTEHNYVQVLQTLQNVFKATLSKYPKVVSKGDLRTIFLNVDELLDAHHLFLDEMGAIMQKTTGRMISRCFAHHMNSFRCYGSFCCEIPDAIAKVKELEAKPVGMKVLEQAKKESKQRFSLKDLLNVPMQRILKYPLLLKELVKRTPEEHPDRPHLAEAKEAIDALAKYINEAKKQHDNLKSMTSSLRNYSGAPLSHYGNLIKDGDLMYKCEGGREKLKIRYCFLFSSAIIVCKPRGTFFTFKSTVELDEDYEVQDIPFWTLPKDEQNGKYAYAWALKKKGAKGSEVSHVFAAMTLLNRKKWMALMEENLSAIRDKKAGPPEAAPRTAGSVGPAAAKPPALPRGAAAAPSISQRPRPGSDKPAAPTKGYEKWVLPGAPGAPAAAAAAAPLKRQGSVSFSKDSAWFASRLPRDKAAKMLMPLRDGTFLVRESENRQGEYSLSIKYGQVKHIKIDRSNMKYELAPDSKSFDTIQELVEHFAIHSLNRHFPGMDTMLETPFRHANIGGSGMGASAAKPAGIGRCRSRFPYVASNSDELSFERGVELTILSKDDQDPGWWRGMLPNGTTGIYPANYVQEI